MSMVPKRLLVTVALGAALASTNIAETRAMPIPVTTADAIASPALTEQTRWRGYGWRGYGWRGYPAYYGYPYAYRPRYYGYRRAFYPPYLGYRRAYYARPYYGSGYRRAYYARPYGWGYRRAYW
jgi:hypothetical protein